LSALRAARLPGRAEDRLSGAKRYRDATTEYDYAIRMTFSQFGQDDFVIALQGRMRGGFFVESGAFDGLLSSNTLALEREYGWHGLCIEANDAVYRRLVHNRNCSCVHACLYTGDGRVEFLESAASAGGIVCEFDDQHRNFVQRVYAPPVDLSGKWATVEKATRSLASILDEHQAPPVIDYWSLDTEGSEIAILQTFPFERYAVRMLTVEHCGVLERRIKIASILEPLGYVFVDRLGIDDCYIAGWDLEARRVSANRLWRKSFGRATPTRFSPN
jgi:hypothetical protein